MINKYATYLKDVHRLPERMIPFYIRWVREAYLHAKTPLKSPLTEEVKNAYLNHCSSQHEDWQVNQADESIRLYLYFLSISGDTPLFDRPALEDWGEFGKEMVRVLRRFYRFL